MGSGMPELGSKISLISKADIRYEGRLFTVDPTECTIALANVRSYGTEDRETQYPVSPQNQVYDYILFRGTDIKDIRVVNNIIPNDPAIMQMQLPGTNQMAPPAFQNQFQVPAMGHMPNQIQQFGVPSGGGGNAVVNPYGNVGAVGVIGGGVNPGNVPNITGAGHMGNNIVSAGAVSKTKQNGSRSTTPVSLISRKSPTADMGVQVNQSSNKDPNRRNSQNRGQPQQQQQQQQQQQHQQQHQRERKDSGRMDGGPYGGNNGNNSGYDNRNNHYNHNQYNQNRGWNRNNPRNNMNNNMNNNRRGFRQNMNHQNNKNRGKSTIKFDDDYDFEQANNKFEELRLELSKLKVNDEANKPEQVNGEIEKKDDSGNETGAGEHEQEDEEVSVGYDKTKSFFDNISCEAATDRSKSKNRTDWRNERKINSETFGVASARRGGFYNYNRGRGGGGYFSQNRNIGGGGYRGNYNRGGTYRGRNYTNHNNNNNINRIHSNSGDFTQNKPEVTTADK